jgi:hypothetical protein
MLYWEKVAELEAVGKGGVSSRRHMAHALLKYWMELFIIVSNCTRTQIQIVAEGNTAVQIATLKNPEHNIWKWMYGTMDTIRTGRLCDGRIVCVD